jgi:hypothetical protein
MASHFAFHLIFHKDTGFYPTYQNSRSLWRSFSLSLAALVEKSGTESAIVAVENAE